MHRALAGFWRNHPTLNAQRRTLNLSPYNARMPVTHLFSPLGRRVRPLLLALLCAPLALMAQSDLPPAVTEAADAAATTATNAAAEPASPVVYERIVSGTPSEPVTYPAAAAPAVPATDAQGTSTVVETFVPEPPAITAQTAAQPAHTAQAAQDVALPQNATEGQPEAQPGQPADRNAVRIYQEDAGSRVEELRVRGQTQTITVTPAGNMPAYEVRPGGNQNYQNLPNRAADGTNGPRRWKIGEF